MDTDRLLDRLRVLYLRRKHAHDRGWAWALVQMDTAVLGFEHIHARSSVDRWARVERRTEQRIQELIKEFENADV